MREVTRAQEMRDLEHRGLGEQGQRFGIDLHEPSSAGLERRHVVAGEQTVRRVVGAGRKDILIYEISIHTSVTVVGRVRHTFLGDGKEAA